MDQSCKQKEAEQCGTAASSEHCLLSEEPMRDSEKHLTGSHIIEGSLFEIDHAHLPPGRPPQLNSIRVAMVCEKTALNVAIRFPSMTSLRAFFNYSKRETHPALDEKFVMDSVLAAKALVKLVPSQVFSEEKSSESFWLTDSSVGEVRKDNITCEEKKGICLSVLKENGMMKWVVRRQAAHLGRHMENDDSGGNTHLSSSCFDDEVAGSAKEETNVVDGTERDEDDGEEEEDSEGNNDIEDFDRVSDDQENYDEIQEEERVEEANGNLKRKRYSFRNLVAKKPKEEKRELKKSKPKPKNQSRKQKGKGRYKEELIPRDPKNRWSGERYKLAEKNLLAVMKLRGATAEKPILRPELRAEARKKIGDTGLLDHLLKHIAGKLAPGRQERFRRRHNPDGAMEYWLESADLANIRKEAGVIDSYWVPPQGWKPGDSPNQDPICARELKLLKDEISEIRSRLDLMATKMQLKEEVQKLSRELEIVNAGRKQEEYCANFIPSDCNIGYALDSEENCSEQFMAISKFVEEMEGKIEKLGGNSDENRGKDLSSVAQTERTPESAQGKQAQKTADNTSAVSPAAEENASDIQTGFICKPQEAFLSIDSSFSTMVLPQVSVQIEVPNPSETLLTYPVRPLAEKRALVLLPAECAAPLEKSGYEGPRVQLPQARILISGGDGTTQV